MNLFIVNAKCEYFLYKYATLKHFDYENFLTYGYLNVKY